MKPKKKLIGEENDNEKQKREKGDGMGDLMGMMKEMYQNGDDEMKKMIAQSW